MHEAGKQTQTDRIQRYLEDFGSITPLDALREFGCMRLGARIWELRNKRGLPISTRYESYRNRYGEVALEALEKHAKDKGIEVNWK